MTTNVSKPGFVTMHVNSAVGKTENITKDIADGPMDLLEVVQDSDPIAEVPDITLPDIIVTMVRQDSAVAVKYGPIGSYMVDLYGMLLKCPTETVHYFGFRKDMNPRWTFDWNTSKPTFKEPIILRTARGRTFKWKVQAGELIPHNKGAFK